MIINKLISIIVPVYNTGNLLRNCVDSLLSQTYSPIEIILVDDGSTDDQTIQIVEEYEKKYPAVRVIRQSNGGPSKARNRGIEEARGEYIGFVDSDDYVDVDAYARLYQMAVKNDVSLVLGELKIEGARQLSVGSGLRDGKHSHKNALSKFMLGSWHSACTNLYAKSLIGDIRFPINEINEDYVFNFEVLLKATDVGIINSPFYHYIKQENSRTGAPASAKHLDWLKHTEYVKDRIITEFGDELREEAIYQDLFANIVLANKSLLSIAKGIKEEPLELYNITVKNLKKSKRHILHNPYISARMRLFGVSLAMIPGIYKSLILNTLRFRK